MRIIQRGKCSFRRLYQRTLNDSQQRITNESILCRKYLLVCPSSNLSFILQLILELLLCPDQPDRELISRHLERFRAPEPCSTAHKLVGENRIQPKII